MKRRRRSMMQRVMVIIIGTLLLNFLVGCFALYRLMQSNTNYIYQLSEELMNASVTEMEQQLYNIQDILYDIIVSDEMQEAGSMLLADKDQGTRSTMERVVGMNAIIDRIQKGISSNHSIVCAHFLEDAGTVRTIAATRYFELSEEAARVVYDRAVAAGGKTVLLNGLEAGAGENLLVLAKEVREKKGLSLRHMGVVVLFADLEQMGQLLTDSHDGIFVLQSEDGRLQFVLNDKEGLLETYEIPDLRGKSYTSCEIGDQRYFAVRLHKTGRCFSYMALVAYEELFGGIEKTFGFYVCMFLLCSAAVMFLAVFFTGGVMKDIRLFIRYISKQPSKDSLQLSSCMEETIRDKDVYALQTAFNAMSQRINDLIKDNYTKQLLIKETQVQALQAQMNPHFLYNTLNSVYWMAQTAGMTAAAEMIKSLGILLREAVGKEELAIPIDKELDIVCHYFVIQKHRYEERLNLEFDVSDICSDSIIPKFAIQALAENAIAYGLECILIPCTIRIRIFPEGDDCICQVRNNGPRPQENLMELLREKKLKTKGNGIGILNIEQRVKYLFGEEYGLELFRDGEETVAQIRMKRITIKEYEEGGQSGQRLQDHDCG